MCLTAAAPAALAAGRATKELALAETKAERTSEGLGGFALQVHNVRAE